MSLLTLEICIGLLFVIYVFLLFIGQGTTKSSKHRNTIFQRRKKNYEHQHQGTLGLEPLQTKSFPRLKLVLYVASILISFVAIAWLYYLNS